MASRCPLCGARRAKRHCPALGREICSVCCGTKRLVEIHCPPDCLYLATARAHPAAAVQRQQERDVRFLMGIVDGLSQVQARLFVLFQSVVRQHRASAIPAINDDDASLAAAALAATLETADRGIIYDHQPPSLQAQRLTTDLKTALEQLREQAPPSLDRDAAAALRRIERAAREARVEVEAGDTAYLDLITRLTRGRDDQPPLRAPEGPGSLASDADEDRPASSGSRLIIP
jgi:hypothetical protein